MNLLTLLESAHAAAKNWVPFDEFKIKFYSEIQQCIWGEAYLSDRVIKFAKLNILFM